MKNICKMHKAEHGHKACELHKTDKLNEPVFSKISGKNMRGGLPGLKEGMGTSHAGSHIRVGEHPGADRAKHLDRAKTIATKNLKSLRNSPKPKLEKACSMHKAEFAKHACPLHKSEEESVPETNEREGMHDDKDESCPYCAEQNEDNRTDDCEMCQALDAQENADGTAGMDDHSDCPYCQALDSEEDTSTEYCPYCDDETVEQANPENSEGIAADDVNPSTNGPDDCPECQKMYGDAVEEQPGQTGQEPPKTQGHETAEEVLDMLDQEPGQGEPPAEEAKQIDNTELPQGDAMEDGTSVPENFGQAQENDVSDADQQFQDQTQQGQEDDQPDMASVMQSGLDDHAAEQKKAQVVDMVAQTLQGFKANKASLEATKEQNMPLYQSCIQMLKSMIALCELLGLQPKMPEEQPAQEMPATQEQAPPAQPAAAPAEGQPDPKATG